METERANTLSESKITLPAVMTTRTRGHLKRSISIHLAATRNSLDIPAEMTTSMVVDRAIMKAPTMEQTSAAVAVEREIMVATTDTRDAIKKTVVMTMMTTTTMMRNAVVITSTMDVVVLECQSLCGNAAKTYIVNYLLCS